METPTFVLFEHAVGYALFRMKEFEEIGQIIPEVEASVADVAKFSSMVKLHAFAPFANTEAALDNCNAISEGLIHKDLSAFLETNLPREKKARTKVGVFDQKLAAAVTEAFPHAQCIFTGVVPEVLRGIRLHCDKLIKGLPGLQLGKAQLGLGHSYSRGKVKFDVHRVDNMVIQSIALLDQLDKDINTFGMRIREWYSYHFPELYKIVSDQYKYSRCVRLIMDRKTMDEETPNKLMEILQDEQQCADVIEASRSSMGMDISQTDLINIERFADRVISLSDYRAKLHGYIKDRMHSCAPNLAALIGEQVGARLISHAGSLTSLAKYPASTVQILGAEKALFRALKTRGNTPKYGLLFHSTFIGRAAQKNKGRISRYLANKCSMAARIDCFSEVPVCTYGEHLRQQVEDRLKYFDTGTAPKKNIEVMKEAGDEASGVQAKELKRRKKQAKKAKKEKGISAEEDEAGSQEAMDEDKQIEEPIEESKSAKKAKKKRKQSEMDETPAEEAAEDTENTPKQKKKKRKS